MAVPSSGPITMRSIRDELENSNYDGSATFSNISLEELSTEEYVEFNTGNSTDNRPDESAPHAMSEFYGYDHDISSGPVVPVISFASTDINNLTLTWDMEGGNTRIYFLLVSLNGTTLYQFLEINGDDYKTSAGSADLLTGNTTYNSGGSTIPAGNYPNDYLTIMARGYDGSSFSDYSSAVTGYTLPGPPTNLSTTSITTTGMTLNWDAPTGGVNASNGYTWYLGTNSTAQNNAGYTTGNTTTSTPTLSQGTQYYWTVKAKGASGLFSNYPTQVAVQTLPGVVSNLAASSVTQNSMLISWTAPTNGVVGGSYILYHGTDSTVENNTALGVSGTSRTVVSLSTGTTYYFAVRAQNGDGNNGAISSTESQATSAGTSIQWALGGKSGFTNVSNGGTEVTACFGVLGSETFTLDDPGDGLHRITVTNGSGDTSVTATTISGTSSYVNHKLSTSSNPASTTGGSGGYQTITTSLNQGTTSVMYYNMRLRNVPTTQNFSIIITVTNNGVTATRQFNWNVTIGA